MQTRGEKGGGAGSGSAIVLGSMDKSRAMRAAPPEEGARPKTPLAMRQMKTVQSMLRQQNLDQEDQPEAETEPSGVAVSSIVAP